MRGARDGTRLRSLGAPGALLSALLAVGCATGGGATTIATGDITSDELEGASFENAYLAVARLRPAWVRPRAAPSFGASPAYPAVYVDGLIQGDIRELERLPVSEVERLRYLTPNDATTRFGTGHTAGAILVTTHGR